MGDRRVKYLDLLQAVIVRMAGNRFTIRTWSVGLGTAVIGYAASKNGNLKASLLAALPAVALWILDAYYLALERKFRGLFDTARQVDDDAPSFSFALDVQASDWAEAAKRPAVWLLHAAVLAVALVVGGRAWLK